MRLDNEEMDCTAVLIENVEEDDVEAIKLIFENEKKTGGGPVRKFKYNKENGNLVIYYEDKNVAQRVLNYSPVKNLGKIFKAKAYSCGNHLKKT